MSSLFVRLLFRWHIRLASIQLNSQIMSKNNHLLNGWFVLDEKRDRAEMCDCSLHGNQELAWMGRKPCHGASLPVYTLKRLGPRLPVGMLQMSLLAFQWVGRGKKQQKKTGHVNRGEMNMKQEERSVSPRGVALTGLVRSPLLWSDSRRWCPPNSARVMTERQLHIGLYQTSPTFLTIFFASPSEIREGVITDGIRNVLWRQKQKKSQKKEYTF